MSLNINIGGWNNSNILCYISTGNELIIGLKHTKDIVDNCVSAFVLNKDFFSVRIKRESSRIHHLLTFKYLWKFLQYIIICQ